MGLFLHNARWTGSPGSGKRSAAPGLLPRAIAMAWLSLAGLGAAAPSSLAQQAPSDDTVPQQQQQQEIAPPAAVPAQAPQPQFNDELTAIERAEAAAFEKLRVDDFAGAVPFVQEALRLSETVFGPEATETGAALQNLGFLLQRTNRLSEAQPYFERALAIYERTQTGPYDDTRKVVSALTEIYTQAGRAEDVLRIQERMLARADESGEAGKDVAIAEMHSKVASMLRAANRADDAAVHWEKAVAVFKGRASPEDEPYLTALEGLLKRYSGLGEAEKARAMIADAMQDLQSQGQMQGKAALLLNNQQSRLEYDAGNYAEAERRALAALAIVERDGPATGPQAVEPLNNLARAERALASNTAAEDNYKRAIAILDKEGDAANSGILSDNLAVLYGQTGRYDEAEIQHKRALQLLEQALGREHREVGRAAANFGVLLNDEGRYLEAEPLLRRGLTIAEASAPNDAVSIAITLDNLGGLLRQTGRQDEAMRHSRRALTLFEQALPANHPSLATSRNNIGRLLLDIGEYGEAETQLQQALTISENLYGTGHVNTAIPAANLGEVYTAVGRRDEARVLLTRAQAILERQFGPDHTKLLDTLVAIGALDLADSKPKDARATFDRAVAIELASRTRFGVKVRPSRDQRATERRAFFGLLEALWQTRDEDQGQNLDRSLEIGQWNTMTPAAMALTALGARAGAGDPELGALTRERQDLAAEWDVNDQKLTLLLAQSTERNTATEQSMRERLATIETRLAAIDAELLVQFPRYEDLAKPEPLSAGDVRALLRPGEAALQYVVAPEATYVWVISGNDSRWLRIPAGERYLLSMVRAVRCGLDRAEWMGAGRERCVTLLDLPKDHELGPTEPLPFQPERAHALHDILLGQLREDIEGRDLLIVASGPLTSLPFHVLVTDKPAPDGEPGGGDLSQIAWLGRGHAVTMLPSLSSLKALRLFAKASQAGSPFLGIGNPLLTGENGTDRSAWSRQTCSPQSTPPSRVAGFAARASLPRLLGGAVDTVEALRRQVPLPETADELCGVAKFVGASADTVLLGGNATESRIKSLSESGALADVRVVHLATHGLIAGETEQFLASRAEPSLMFTPPETASDVDDGLLTASEVATLKLDADWVVLSACNTASGDHVGAEALSGLSRAFFYAGARSLMVSHWGVDSDATVKLITGAFAARADSPEIGQAKALQRSMMAMIDAGGQQSHPEFWAPFIVVGSDGGAKIAEDTVPIVIPPVPEKAPAVKQASINIAPENVPPPPMRLVIGEEVATVPPLPVKASAAVAAPAPVAKPEPVRRSPRPERRKPPASASAAPLSSSPPAAQRQQSAPAAQKPAQAQTQQSVPAAQKPAQAQTQPPPTTPAPTTTQSTSSSGTAPSSSGSFWSELFGQ
jgi:CHAT domain-containing protein/tetratricopeptide (TPR) repeat protein